MSVIEDSFGNGVEKPTSPPSESRHPRQEFRVTDVRAWILRHGLIVLALAILGALGASIYTSSTQSATYRASAILAIVPPKFSSELLPSTLTVQGYQELLESDAVLAETEARLVEQGLLADGAQLKPSQVKSKIFVSQRREETSLAPLIRLEVRSPSAERAAAIANTWAEVFLDRVQDLMFGSISTTVQLIEEQYPKARDRLNSLEDERLEKANAIDQRRANAVSRWQQELARAAAETSRLLNDYATETNRLMSSFRTGNRIQARRNELESLYDVLEGHQRERAQVEARLVAKERELRQLREQLSRTPPTLVLTRSLPEDVVIGEAVKEAGTPDVVETLSNLRLSYEVQNPLFNELSLTTSQRETEVAMLRPRGNELKELVGREIAQIKELETSLTEDEAGLNQIRSERETGLDTLRQTRAAVESAFATRRETELSSIDRESTHLFTQLDRQIEQERSFFEELAGKYNETLLAKGQERIEAIRMAAPAVLPRRPLSAGHGSSAALGLLLGGLVGLVVAVGRDWVRDSHPGNRN